MHSIFHENSNNFAKAVMSKISLYKMSFLLLYIFGSVMYCNCEIVSDELLDQTGLQTCRDNANKPVPWWYIYKPPADIIHPSGQNFSFITPDTGGRWMKSLMDITDDSNMLSNTLMPTFRHSYMNRVGRAMVVFDSRADPDSRSSARGVLIAGREGGLLLTHSVPGFPGKQKSFLFPPDQLENGHLLACLSLGLDPLNKVARAIKEIAPNIIFLSVPDSFADILPGWDFEDLSAPTTLTRLRPSMYSLIRVNASHFHSKVEPVEAVLVARPPGVKTCIYSSFAARQLVMLNVYGQSSSTYLSTVCNHGFGIRNIDSLCLKYDGSEGGPIYYVTNSTDFSWFAVSTAAHWQERGAGPRQFWVCTSLLDKEDVSGESGLLLCLQNYNLWVAFDNLKVAEPSCE